MLAQSSDVGAGEVFWSLFATLGLLAGSLALFALYWLPSVVAVARKHHHLLAIAALNAFLGWTVIGWIAALVWALTAVQERRAD